MEKVGVYLHGSIGRHNYWYRIELQMPTTQTHTGKRKRIIYLPTLEEISPVAIMCDARVGSWDVIDDTIYCIGCTKYEGRASSLITDLLKHNIEQHKDNPSFWETESSTWHKPRSLPFVAAIDTNKLCVISGHRYIPCKVDFSDYRYSAVDDEERERERDRERERMRMREREREREEEMDDDYEEEEMNKFFKMLNSEKRYNDHVEKSGEVYDIGTKCWKLFGAKSLFKMFNVFNQATVVEKDGEQPTQIVSYALSHGIIHVFDVPSGTSKPPEYHKDLSVWSFDGKDTLPRGLTYPEDFGVLRLVANNVTAVFANGVFYWVSHTLRLYGYDTHAKTWLLSRSLEGELPPVIFGFMHGQNFPILLHLRNGKFLLTILKDYGEVTMAFLTVHKAASCLDVSVDLVQSFEFSHKSFMPTDGKAVLLNNTS